MSSEDWGAWFGNLTMQAATFALAYFLMLHWEAPKWAAIGLAVVTSDLCHLRWRVNRLAKQK